MVMNLDNVWRFSSPPVHKFRINDNNGKTGINNFEKAMQAHIHTRYNKIVFWFCFCFQNQSSTIGRDKYEHFKNNGWTYEPFDANFINTTIRFNHCGRHFGNVNFVLFCAWLLASSNLMKQFLIYYKTDKIFCHFVPPSNNKRLIGLWALKQKQNCFFCTLTTLPILRHPNLT